MLVLFAGANVGRSKAAIVKCDKVEVGKEWRWKLTDVIGEEDGLGIECLSGSGAIARSAPCLPLAASLYVLALFTVCLSVCLSVCPSVWPRLVWIVHASCFSVQSSVLTCLACLLTASQQPALKKAACLKSVTAHM